MKPGIKRYTSRPFDKKNWEAVLTAEPLPILEETRNRMHAALRDKQVNFRDLAPLVEQDPALCLALQRLAVKYNPDCLQQISGAANCLSLVGMKEVVKLVKQLPTVSADTTDEQLQAYRCGLITCAMAGTLAAVLTEQKSNNSEHYARWATMMAGMSLLAWLLHSDQARNWHYYLGHGLEPDIARRAIWGDDLTPWQRWNAKHSLPPLARALWNPKQQPSLHQWRLLRHYDPWDLPTKIGRPLLHLCQRPELTSTLALSLAWHLQVDSYSRRSERWLQLTANWLGKPVYVLLPRVREVQFHCAGLYQDAFATGLHRMVEADHPHRPRDSYPWIAPAAGHRSAPAQPDVPAKDRAKSVEADTPHRETPPSRTQDKAQTTDATTDKTTDKTRQPEAETAPENAASSEQHARQVANLQQQMEQNAGSFGDWNTLMTSLLKGINEDIELSFAAVWLPNKDKTRLRLVYQSGLATDHPLQRLHIDIQQINLFRKIMQRNAAIAVQQSNRRGLLEGLDPAVRDQLPETFMLMSVSAGSRPIGVVMAGNQQAGQTPPNTTQYQQFKQLCHSASTGLATLREQSLARQGSNS